MASIDSTIQSSCGLPNAKNRIFCGNAVPVKAGSALGTVGGTGYGQNNYWTLHLHFEFKSFAHLGTSGNDSGEFGYTTSLPDQLGYYDPTMSLHVASGVAGPVLLTLTQNASLLVGPGGSGATSYRVVALLNKGDTFDARQFSGPTTTPLCPKGWYEIAGTDGTYFLDYLKPGQIPAAWICAEYVTGP